MLIDTHAHLNMDEYSDISEVLKRSEEAGVEAIIDVGFDIESSKDSLKLSNSHSKIYSAVGFHPHDSKALNDSSLKELIKLALGEKVVAIGETGLDYYRNLSPKDVQIKAFIAQISLAQELDLPIIVHARNSHDDILRILHEENRGSLKGVMHCFSGDERAARLSLDLGFYISFAGTLTFKKAQDLRDAAKFVPLDRILIETDCPYLAPEPYRGKRNEPSYLRFIAGVLAEVKSVDIKDLESNLKRNAKTLFSKLNI